MAGFERSRNALESRGAEIIAATVDPEDRIRELAEREGYTIPIAHGVTREQAEAIGAFWNPQRDHIQPTEFLIDRDGRVRLSVYASGPVGRMDPEVLAGYLDFLAKREG